MHNISSNSWLHTSTAEFNKLHTEAGMQRPATAPSWR